MSLFTACILSFAVIAAAFGAFDPCDESNHNLLDQPDRSTGVKLKKGATARTDENLSQGWYRFVSGAGKTIPTSAPTLGACSSRKPIWINGTQPPSDGAIHTLNMCYFLSDYDPCGIKLQIQAKACAQGIVYELLPTSAANSSQRVTGGTYCAGSEVLCPPGQSSLTGFTPGCYKAPTVAKRPIIDLVVSPDAFEFHCVLGNKRPQAAYKVTWKLDYMTIDDQPLQFGKGYGVLKHNQLRVPRGSVLGRNLTCLVRGRYLNEPADHWGAPKSSEPYFLGIEVTDASGMPLRRQSNTLVLPESDNNQLISIKSTIPIRCDPTAVLLSGQKCQVVIAIRNNNTMDKKPLRCRNGVVEQLKLATCGVTLTPDNWNIEQPISIRATKDFKYNGQRPRTVEFQMTDAPGSSVWDGYVPHSLKVITEDFIDKRAQCRSLNDPHMTTFDGHRWNNYFEGEFVLYRHTELPFEVRAFYRRCRARSSVSCNCAVAARAGDDVIIIDRCNSLGDVKLWGSDKKVEYNLLRTRTISTDDVISPNFKIFAVNGGREYAIYFPHGAVLKAQLTGGGYAQFMNLWLSPSPADFNKTIGMCGTFNGDKTEDLRMRDGSLFTGAGAGNNQQPKEFSKHWRVDPAESIYNGQVPATEKTYKKQYCSCLRSAASPTAPEYLDCDMNTDALRCDQRGKDITGDNFEFSAGVPKNAKPFVFDPNFVPADPSWPTPSGWTKANATLFCQDFLKKSRAYQECKGTVNVDSDVDMCVEDIRLTDGIEFAMTALEAFKERCLSEMSKDPDAVIPRDAFCINECNHNGDCLDGVCHCFSGFASEDCGLRKSSIPNVFFTPFCDVATQRCDSANVYGDGFVDSQDLTCTFQPAEISGGKLKMKGAKEEVRGAYENFAEVRCPLRGSRAKRAAASNAVPAQLALQVANQKGAKASNVVIYTRYNSMCQECDENTAECKVKTGMCLIEGNCYKDGDRSPKPVKDVHPYCDPNESQSTWYFPAKPTEGLPGWAIGVIAAAATLALVSFGLVVYMKVVRKRVKVVA